MSTKLWNELRISPSKLGALCSPEFCSLCYWRLLRLKFRKPHAFPMPAILNSLDAQHKQLAELFLDRKKKLPKYFGSFVSAVEILPIASLSGFHDETGLELYGKPDLVLRDASGKVMVVDNKTAKIKLADHPLTAMYQAQVNFYGFLLERSPEAYEVSKVGLLYYQFRQLTDDELMDVVGDSYMDARFDPKLVEVEYNPESIVIPLLERVRALIDMTSAPNGKEDCKDCDLLSAFHDVARVADGVRAPLFRDDQRRYLADKFLFDFGLDDALQTRMDSLYKDAQPFGVLAQWMLD